MRVVVVGPAAERARLRAGMNGTDVDVVGEASTLTAARAAGLDADAYLLSAGRLNGPAGDADGGPDPLRLDAEPGVESLTPRELDVVKQLALGLPNKLIAGRLGISDQTVKFHVASILGKLGAANRTDVVRRAVRKGLIDL
jgi:DNA-binding NarL/FixJ family response regulator